MSEPAANQLPTPGPQHDLLKPFEGTFEAVVKIHAGQEEPIQTTGKLTSQFTLDGLYLEQHYIGDFVEGPFPTFTAR